MRKEKILVTGAAGQIGTVLTETLRDVFGNNQVVASDLRLPENSDGPAEILNALDGSALEAIVKKHKINQIYHLVAMLSATGEKDPMRAWDINMTSLFNVLTVARDRKMHKVYFPSSIAVFGKEAPRVNTPQFSVLIPETVYGISKVAGENWCQYFWKKYGVDVRSLRYPGIIGYQSLPGGGTTDYAVDIYHHAVQNKPFSCFLREGTRLPMLYMADAIRGTLELMESAANKLSIRTSYNLAGVSFSPEEIAGSIQRRMPEFKINYQPDFRQAIADSWPESIDDSVARSDWGWKPEFDLDKMTGDMLYHLVQKYSKKEI